MRGHSAARGVDGADPFCHATLPTFPQSRECRGERSCAISAATTPHRSTMRERGRGSLPTYRSAHRSPYPGNVGDRIGAVSRPRGRGERCPQSLRGPTHATRPVLRDTVPCESYSQCPSFPHAPHTCAGDSPLPTPSGGRRYGGRGKARTMFPDTVPVILARHVTRLPFPRGSEIPGPYVCHAPPRAVTLSPLTREAIASLTDDTRPECVTGDTARPSRPVPRPHALRNGP